MPRGRLRIGDISLRTILQVSKEAYTKLVDNKAKRSKMDVLSATINIRKNLTYDRSTRTWEQTGREVKIAFMIRTEPISYKKTDKISPHKYPITFLIKDFSQGMDSAFRCRVGSLKRPLFGKGTGDKNTRRMVQMQFIVDSMWVYNKNRLLWGPDYTNGPPKKRNPRQIPFFSKHEYWLVTKAFPKIFSSKQLRGRFT